MTYLPVWAHVTIAMSLAFIGIWAFYGCLHAADSPLARHLLGVCESRACSRCVRRKRREKADEMAREARR